MKKSVSSSTARSGDVEDEVSDGASLESRAEGRGREGILAGGEEEGSGFEVQFDFLFGSS
jgi:hypothetical protein